MRFKEFLAQENARFDEELAFEGVPEAVRKNFSALAVAATVAMSFISAHQIVKMDTEQLQRNKQIFSQIEKAAAEAERQRLKALQEKAKQSALGIASKFKDSGASGDFGKYERARQELEDFAKSLQVKYKIEGSLSEGKVHTIRNSDIKPRGAPEVPARAFDRPNADRSVLKQLDKLEFYVLEGEIDWHDWSDERNDRLMKAPNSYRVILSCNKYPKTQIACIFGLKDTKLELDYEVEDDVDVHAWGDHADFLVNKHKSAIIQAALKAIRTGDVPDIYDGLGGRSVPKNPAIK